MESKKDYEILGSMFSGTPTFCIVPPKKDPILPESVIPLMIKEAKVSIDSWTMALKSSGKDSMKWDANVVVISQDKQKPKCDVLIQFQKKDPAEVNPLSLFKNKPLPYVTNYELPDYKYHNSNGMSLIQIFYQAKGTCEQLDWTSSETYIKTSWDCRQNDVAPVRVLGAVMRHAIGHALGLGHYKGYSNSSIMSELPKLVGYDARVNPESLVVTSLDVQKLKEIYGSEGWGDEKITTKKIEQKTTTNIKPKIIHIKKGQTTIETISGSIPTSLYTQGGRADITILKPDGTSESQKIGVSGKGKFVHPFSITDNTPRGKYYVTVSYFGNDITKMVYELR